MEIPSRIKRKIQELIKEYTDNGYQVIIDSVDFPDFLRDLQPDLIAISDSDNVVVEVTEGKNPQNTDKIKILGSIVESQPGWRFDFVVTNPRKPELPDTNPKELQKRLTEAKTLFLSDLYVPAMLCIWPAIEGALRIQFLLWKIEKIAPKTLLSQLKFSLHEGLLGRSDYDLLEKGLQIRNTLAHGFEAEPISKDLISQLILIAEELLRADEDDTETDEIEEAVDKLVAWFNENYEDPAEAVPYESAEGGYIYYAGGPYDPIEELSENFPDVDEHLIKLAADKLYQTLTVWVRRGQYP